ncbi:MAG: polysaccharide biosynthesis tyrosine autokinase [Bacteroidota bacterium]
MKYQNPEKNAYPYTGNYAQEQLPEISLSSLINKTLKNWYWFLLSMAVCLAAAFLFLRSQHKEYRVAASLFIHADQKNHRGDTEFMKETEYFNKEGQLEDEIEILSSHSLISQTLAGLNFGMSYYVEESWRKIELTDQEIPFEVLIDSSHLQLAHGFFRIQCDEGSICYILSEGDFTLYDPLEKKEINLIKDVKTKSLLSWEDEIETDYYKFQIKIKKGKEIPDGSIYFFRLHTEHDLVKNYKTRLQIKPSSEESKIVNMALEGPVISKNLLFMEELIENYLQNELAEKQAAGKRMRSFINQRLALVSDSLQGIENKLSDFRTGNDMVDPSSAASILQSRIESLETNQVEVDQKLNYHRYLLRNLKEGDEGSIPALSLENTSDPLLKALLEDLSQMMDEKTSLEFSTTATHPQYKLLEDKIAQSRRAIKQNIEDHIRNMEIKQRELDKKLIESKEKLMGIPNYEKNLNKIERAYEAINDNYKYLQEKGAEADLALANQDIQHKIIDPPHLSSKKPIKPNSVLIFGLALFFGMGLPFLLILGKDVLNKKVSGLQDVYLSTPIPIAGYIIKNDTEKNIIDRTNLRSLFAESFRTLRVKMRYQNPNSPLKVVGITSSWSGEGKSFCSANLACAMGMVGDRTLLMDLDFRKPSLQSYFGHEGDKGLLHFLRHECELDEIICSTHIPHLSFMPVGEAYYNPLDLLDSDRFRKLMMYLKQKFDRIIIDTPPMGITADYMMFQKWVDHTLYVVRQDFTETQALKEINDVYERGQIPKISLVINAVTDLQKFQYGEHSLSKKQKKMHEKYYGKVFAEG